jgi:uncharacterized protein YuzE
MTKIENENAKEPFLTYIREDLQFLSVKELGLVYKLVRALITGMKHFIIMRQKQLENYVIEKYHSRHQNDELNNLLKEAIHVTAIDKATKYKVELTDRDGKPIILSIDYDSEADVLYMTFNKNEMCKYEETDDLVIRKTQDNKLKGITIIHFGKRIGVLK